MTLLALLGKTTFEIAAIKLHVIFCCCAVNVLLVVDHDSEKRAQDVGVLYYRLVILTA